MLARANPDVRRRFMTGSLGRASPVRERSVSPPAVPVTKSRADMLSYINSHCYGAIDTITQEEFAEMSDEDLAGLVMIGSGPVKHCFNRRMMKQWVASNPTNPTTREEITQEELGKIRRNVAFYFKNSKKKLKKSPKRKSRGKRRSKA